MVRYLLTLLVVVTAISAAIWRYSEYAANPWTRDGQVMANVIQIAPRVSGPIIDLPIRDNQWVQIGDPLFEVDPRTYVASKEQAQANYDRTINDIVALKKQVAAAEAQVEQAKANITQSQAQMTVAESTLLEAELELNRNAALLEANDVSQARYDAIKRDYDIDQANKGKAAAALAASVSGLAQAEAQLAQARAQLGAEGDKNERLRAAAAQLESARLEASFTKVTSPVDGYITNLDLRLGSQAVAYKPSLALIDEKSFWVAGYFRETFVSGISVGDDAVITLMGYPDQPIRGHVDSIGWGIALSDGSTSANLLPTVKPTYQWIRLAQRIPVRIELEELPEGVELRVGQTASVLVHTGSAKSSGKAAPSLLQ